MPKSSLSFVVRDLCNEAVKKSREKAKQKSDEIAKTIERLTSENQDLEERKLMLNKELSLLKELFVSYGGNEINWVLLIFGAL